MPILSLEQDKHKISVIVYVKGGMLPFQEKTAKKLLIPESAAASSAK